MGLFERLDLADNTLGEEGGSVLAEVLASQPSLTYVNLRDCELEVSIGDWCFCFARKWVLVSAAASLKRCALELSV